jgi:hypothetical protein
MIQYPSLCKEFIALVSEIFEYFPDKLPEMDISLLSNLLHSLVYGIKHTVFSVSSCAFDAIVFIGFYAWFEITKFGIAKLFIYKKAQKKCSSWSIS